MCTWPARISVSVDVVFNVSQNDVQGEPNTAPPHATEEILFYTPEYRGSSVLNLIF